MIRRRTIGLRENKSDESAWDYEITDPNNRYGAIRIDVKAGDIFYIEWDPEGVRGYVYDMRGCGGGFLNPVYSSGYSALNGKCNITITEDGHIVFGYKFDYKENGAINMNDRFNGKYIKIRRGG